MVGRSRRHLSPCPHSSKVTLISKVNDALMSAMPLLWLVECLIFTQIFHSLFVSHRTLTPLNSEHNPPIGQLTLFHIALLGNLLSSEGSRRSH